MSRVLAALMATAITLAGAPAQAQNFGGWEVQALGSSCMMQASFDGGTTVAFLAYRDGRVDLMIHPRTGVTYAPEFTYASAIYRFVHDQSGLSATQFVIRTHGWQVASGPVVQAELPAESLAALARARSFSIEFTILEQRYREHFGVAEPAAAVQALRACLARPA